MFLQYEKHPKSKGRNAYLLHLPPQNPRTPLHHQALRRLRIPVRRLFLLQFLQLYLPRHRYQSRLLFLLYFLQSFSFFNQTLVFPLHRDINMTRIFHIMISYFERFFIIYLNFITGIINKTIKLTV